MTDYPIIVHQSDLNSWNWCPAKFHYERQGHGGQQNSRLAYGTIIHRSMHILERERDLDKAIESFLYYWHPMNIEAITPRVPKDGWIGRDSYGAMRSRGVKTLRGYADLKRFDEDELLALEFPFIVPLEGTPYYLAGTVDRLAVRWYRQRETLATTDWKSGRRKYRLRHNLQGSIYSYASHHPEYWYGNEVTGYRLHTDELTTYKTEGFSQQEPLDSRYESRAEELHRRFEGSPRRFVWIDLNKLNFADGGYRGPRDYQRVKLAVHQVVQSVKANIFPLRIDGTTCMYCPARDYCGGMGVPDEHHGDPAFRYAPEYED